MRTAAVLWLMPLVAITAPLSPASAQDRAASAIPPGGQVGAQTDDDPLPPVDQLSRPAARASAPVQVAPRAAARSDATQVSGTVRDSSRTVQITPGRRNVQPGQQLSAGEPTADASAPLSFPAQGRRQAAERLAGRDRCDPAVRSASSAACARVIETRSGEFVRADPLVLSPEQRLLVDQKLREIPGSATAAIDRIGRNNVDADSAGAQGLASVALALPGAEAPPPAESDPTGGAASGIGAALIEALVERAQASPR